VAPWDGQSDHRAYVGDTPSESGQELAGIVQSRFMMPSPSGSQADGGEMARRKRFPLYARFIFFPVWLLLQSRLITGSARAEARRIAVTRQTLELRQWPSAFDGLTLAFLTDLHCGPLTPPEFLAQVVEETNRLKPDMILLGGDYVTQDARYVPAVVEVLPNWRRRWASIPSWQP